MSEFDPRQTREDLNQIPCLADPNLTCFPECSMWDLEDRTKAVNEANLELPPWTDIYRHHFDPDEPELQQRLEKEYRTKRSQLISPLCDLSQ